MSLWKISSGLPVPIPETEFATQSINEADLEGWVAEQPDLLGEPLLVFGRQVHVEGLGDTIDLLALDPKGHLVVIEMKRGDLKAPVDIQALRYTSYVSRWTEDDLEQVAASYFSNDPSELTLAGRFAEFVESLCEEEEPETLNSDQRMMIVGQQVRDRLGSVALWLREKGIDVKLVEIHPFINEGELLLSPRIIIPPLGTERWEQVGAKSAAAVKPWLQDGLAWHRKRAGAGFERVSTLTRQLDEAGLVDEVSYAQKHYITLKRGGKVWIYMEPGPSQLKLSIRIRPSELDHRAVAKRLGLDSFEGDLKKKLALGSSVAVWEGNGSDELIMRLKADYDLCASPLVEFLGELSDRHARGSSAA